MRKSLLFFGRLVTAALAWLTAPVFAIGIGPTTSPTPIAYGSLTPGIGVAPKPPHRRWHIEGNTATPFAVLKRLVDRVRHRTSSKGRFYIAAGRALAT